MYGCDRGAWNGCAGWVTHYALDRRLGEDLDREIEKEDNTRDSC